MICKIRFLLFVWICFCMNVWAQKPIKVACVGNSITYGAFIQNREHNSYPAQLAAYLGDAYEVKNFGVSGRTLLGKGDLPYRQTEAYQQSLSYQPDIVFIKLGTNDSKPQNRIYLKSFKEEMLQLIDSYRQLPSSPRIVLLTPLRCFIPGHETICDSVITTEITPVIKEIAYEQKLDIINLYHLFGDQWQSHLMPDQLHPSAIGAGQIAAKLYDYLKLTGENSFDITKTFALKPVRQFNFHGYQGHVYTNKGITYYIVKPYQVAKDLPWIWRARFWGHEPQTDIALLEHGFHVVYCDVADLYGSDRAVRRWNEFYQLATDAGLNRKVVLEGMSRGGLIVYNWAAANPDKVACIYADAPVMDFKSWPMGRGGSAGSVEDTKKLYAAYGFASEQQALDWKKNPIDHAAILAEAAIPIIHVVGDADDVVPVSENTDLFVNRLTQLGGTIKVIHKPEVGHHPHSLANPDPIVYFILKSIGQAANRCIHPVPGNEYRSGAGWVEGSDWHTVNQDIQAALAGKNLQLLMIGNSITQGLGGNREAVVYKPGKQAMDDRFGEGNWETAGISGDRTQHVLWRLMHGHYADCQPQVVVLTIGINNVIAGDDPDDIAEGIKACAVEAHKQMPSSRLILLGLLPAGKEPDSSSREACDKIHELLSEASFQGVEYINPTAWFIHKDGSLRTELFGEDFLHLNSEGYSVWCDHLYQLIRE